MCRSLAQSKKLNFNRKQISKKAKNTLSVHFSSISSNDVDITILEISKLSPKEIEASWYSYDEYEEMRTSFSYAVFAIDMKDNNGTDHFDDNDKFNEEYNNDIDSTIMGLENQTVEGKWERHVHRQDCNFAVFDLQDEQEKIKERTKRKKRLSMSHTNSDTDDSNNEEIEIATKFQLRIAEACKESTTKPAQISQQKAIKLASEVLSYNASPSAVATTTTTTNGNGSSSCVINEKHTIDNENNVIVGDVVPHATANENTEIKAGKVRDTKNKRDKNLKALCSHWDRQQKSDEGKLMNDASIGCKLKAKGRKFSRRSSMPTRMSEPKLVVSPSLVQQCVDNNSRNQLEVNQNSSEAKSNHNSAFMEGTDNNDYTKKTVCKKGSSNSNKRSTITYNNEVTVATASTTTTTTPYITTDRVKKANSNIREGTKRKSMRRSSMPRLCITSTITSINNTCIIKPTVDNDTKNKDCVKLKVCNKSNSDKELRSKMTSNDNDITKVSNNNTPLHKRTRRVARRSSMPLLSNPRKSNSTTIKSKISMFNNNTKAEMNYDKSNQGGRRENYKRRTSMPFLSSIETGNNKKLNVAPTADTNTAADDVVVVPKKSVISKISMFNNLKNNDGGRINRRSAMQRRSSMSDATESKAQFPQLPPRRSNSDTMKSARKVTTLRGVETNNNNGNGRNLEKERVDKINHNKNSNSTTKKMGKDKLLRTRKGSSLPQVNNSSSSSNSNNNSNSSNSGNSSCRTENTNISIVSNADTTPSDKFPQLVTIVSTDNKYKGGSPVPFLSSTKSTNSLLPSYSDYEKKGDIDGNPLFTEKEREQQQPTSINVGAMIARIQSKNNHTSSIYIQSVRGVLNRDHSSRTILKIRDEYSALLKQKMKNNSKQHNYEATRNTGGANAA